MRIYLITLIMIALLTGFNLQAGETLTLKQVISDQKKYSPKNLEHTQWIGEKDLFVFCLDSVLYQQDGPESKHPLLTLAELNASLIQEGVPRFKSFPDMHWQKSGRFYFWKSDSMITYDAYNKKIIKITTFPKDAKNTDVSPHEYHIAFTLKNNLYIRKADGSLYQVTDESIEIVSGQSVSRHEFGIDRGTFWSPKDTYLAFYQKDESQVDDYPFVNFDSLPAQIQPGKYPMAGRASETVRIGIFRLTDNSVIWLPTEKTGEKEQYLTSLTWSPDEKQLYVAHVSRDQNRLQMVAYDITKGGKPTILFSEEDEQYVDPQFRLFFRDDDPDRFLWFSERDGWNHLYLYMKDGTFVSKVTRGSFDVTEFLGFSRDGEWIFYEAAYQDPTGRQIFKSRIGSGGHIQITRGHGTWQAQKSKNSDLLLLSFSSLDTPREWMLGDSNGAVLDTLLVADDPLAGFNIGTTKIESLKTETGELLYCRIIFPPEFDENKKYPVLVYVYGGPHSQHVQNSWLGRSGLWLQFMATRGYIVFTMDNRGTDYRGLEFEQITHGRLGTVEVADQVLGLQNLISRSYVDPDRIGVFGWSYGGFMTASLMTRSPQLFKAGVAGAPVIDWKYYEVMYTERYMETPQANPVGYEESSVLNHLDSLKNDLLVIHGTSDDIVMWQHTIVFVKEAVKKGIQVDYMIYPGHLHGVRGPDRLHLYQKITDYLNERLLSDPENAVSDRYGG